MNIRRRLTRQGGSILVMTAISLVALLGMTALAVDAAYFLDYRNDMAAAADAAALAGAREIKRASWLEDDKLANLARHEAAANGFTDGVDGVAVDVRRCGPSSSCTAGRPFSSRTGYVEVVISRPVPTFFMKVFNRMSMIVSTRAVAGADSGGTLANFIVLCHVEPPTTSACPQSADVQGNITANGAVIVDSSNAAGLSLNTGTKLYSPGIYVTGATADKCTTGVPANEGCLPLPPAPPSPRDNVHYNEPLTQDPIAYAVTNGTRVLPSCASPCTVYTAAIKCTTTCDHNGKKVLQPGEYQNSVLVDGGPIYLNGGVYRFTASSGLKVKGGTLYSCGHSSAPTPAPAECTDNGGVTLFMDDTSSTLEVVNTSTVYLKAPDGGPTEAMLLWQKSGNSQVVKFADSTAYLTGVLYAPSGKIDFGGDAGLGGVAVLYTSFISWELKVHTSGNITFDTNILALDHGSPTNPGAGIVSLAE